MTSLHPAPPLADSGAEPAALPGDELLKSLLAGTAEDEDPVTHVHRLPARPGRVVAWPDWVGTELRDRLTTRGVV
ncbi:hypothetical protein A7K94_0212355, partial [Modestobacter sp. VKM Ac-2676]